MDMMWAAPEVQLAVVKCLHRARFPVMGGLRRKTNSCPSANLQRDHFGWNSRGQSLTQTNRGCVPPPALLAPLRRLRLIGAAFRLLCMRRARHL